MRSRVERGGGGSGITSSAARPTTYLTGDRFTLAGADRFSWARL